jgi:hypothetical protein
VLNPPGTTLAWQNEILTVRSADLPVPVEMLYIEAYCRPGSSDRPWPETVIPHTSKLVSAAPDGSQLELLNTLADGVTVTHKISAGAGEVAFQLSAHNPTRLRSEVDWGQPCLRVGPFTGYTGGEDIEDYLEKCFVYINGRLTRLPLKPWSSQALYVPGQVWRHPGVSARDVNPRPLNPLIPSSGLIGCFSSDESLLLATSWKPYQELFQGIFRCIHADFRFGGLAPGETKTAYGKLYWMANNPDGLVTRYTADFGE